MSHKLKNRWLTVIEHLTIAEDQSGLNKLIGELVNSDKPAVLSFVNAHAMNTLISSDEFYQAIIASDFVFRDGSGLSYLLKSRGLEPGLNLNGTDLIPKIISNSQGTVALFGTQEPYLTKAKIKIESEVNPDLKVVMTDGFSNEEAYVALAKEREPNLIVLGMGMPKQEKVAQRLKSELVHPCIIVCGGAIIDFLGGKVSRAPSWMRRLGIEWVYRLMLEPKRLFRRYVLGNPLFLFRVNRLNR